MHPFALERPRDLNAAVALRAQAGRNDAPAEYIAGGTDMVQLLQEDVRRPERLVSLAGLLDNRIEIVAQGLRVGAAATMTEVAAHPAVVEQFPVISEALLNSASPQVRNQATMGGAAPHGWLRHPLSGRDPQEGDDEDRDDSFRRGWFGPGWAHVAPTQARRSAAPAAG